jgi:hypothetical protein
MAWDLLKLNKGDICLSQKKNRICQERIRSGQRLGGGLYWQKAVKGSKLDIIYPPSQKATDFSPWMNAKRVSRRSPALTGRRRMCFGGCSRTLEPVARISVYGVAPRLGRWDDSIQSFLQGLLP